MFGEIFVQVAAVNNLASTWTATEEHRFLLVVCVPNQHFRHQSKASWETLDLVDGRSITAFSLVRFGNYMVLQ